MLDEKDIQRLKEELVTKEDLEEFSVKVFQTFVTKEEINELRKEIAALKESIQTLTISVDKLAKIVEDMHQEYIAITSKVDRLEKWVHQIAKKIGMKLEY
jgi:uncharacterized coiled-coil DUF342 family protein